MQLPEQLQNNQYSAIVEKVASALMENKLVYALWVEGSIAQGKSDKYSDLDIWASVADGYEDEIFSQVEGILTKLGSLDINYKMLQPHPKIFHKVYHIEGTSEFQTIDMNVQQNSRIFTMDEGVDDYLIIFDKAEVVKSLKQPIKEQDWSVVGERLRQFYALQHPNIIKNLERNKPLEAKLYYDYLVDFVIKTFRLRYTPDKVQYSVKHIYRDLKPEDIQFIQRISFVANKDDIQRGLGKIKEFVDHFDWNKD